MPKGVPNPKINKAMPLWFYLDDVLHERIHVDRTGDKLTAWNYGIGERVIYSLRAVKLKQKPAYTTAQVGRMVNRSALTLLRYIEWGEIKPPAKGIRHGKAAKQTAYRWSDKDILALHEFIDQPRKLHGPSRRELVAQLNNEEVLYVQNSDGTFVPTWRAKEF